VALTKVNGGGVGTLSSGLTLTSDDPTITMTDSSGTNDTATLQATSGALIVTARDGSADGEIIFKKTDGSTTDETMRIDSSGRVTMPYQTAFQVYKSSNNQNNIAADNSSVVVTWDSEAFDIGSNFASNTFTAPVTGKYLLTAKLRIDDADSASQYYILKLDCSNGDAFDISDSNVFSSDITYLTLQVTTVQDMDANDTAQVQITQQGGTSQSDIIGARHYSNFSGYLLG
jgi:hypothetical protein